jgi:hypothetical protein
MRKLFLLLVFLLLPFVAKAQSTKECILVSVATTNATACNATVTTSTRLYGWTFVNTTATIYYLRLYNLAAAPTCSSATGFVRSIPLLATQSTVIDFGALPVIYSAGLGFCLTGGSSSTDNTAAAVGVYGALRYSLAK